MCSIFFFFVPYCVWISIQAADRYLVNSKIVINLKHRYLPEKSNAVSFSLYHYSENSSDPGYAGEHKTRELWSYQPEIQVAPGLGGVWDTLRFLPSTKEGTLEGL